MQEILHKSIATYSQSVDQLSIQKLFKMPAILDSI